jgi:hypothetical protein
MVNNYHLTAQQISRGIHLCLSNADSFLAEAEAILSLNPRHALGLYTYAIEEFGKAYLLKKRLNPNGINCIPTWIFAHFHSRVNGKRAHRMKYDYANLPAKCRYIPDGVVKITSNTQAETRRVVYHFVKARNKKDRMKKRREVSTPGSATGTFQNVTLPPIEVDDELRNACFYVDWDEDAKQWIPAENYRIDVEHLRATIGIFHHIIARLGTCKARKPNSELVKSNKKC